MNRRILPSQALGACLGSSSWSRGAPSAFPTPPGGVSDQAGTPPGKPSADSGHQFPSAKGPGSWSVSGPQSPMTGMSRGKCLPRACPEEEQPPDWPLYGPLWMEAISWPWVEAAHASPRAGCPCLVRAWADTCGDTVNPRACPCHGGSLVRGSHRQGGGRAEDGAQMEQRPFRSAKRVTARESEKYMLLDMLHTHSHRYAYIHKHILSYTHNTPTHMYTHKHTQTVIQSDTHLQHSHT